MVTPAGIYTLSDGFTVTGEPTVTGVDPNKGYQGETKTVVISGTDFAVYNSRASSGGPSYSTNP